MADQILEDIFNGGLCSDCGPKNILQAAVEQCCPRPEGSKIPEQMWNPNAVQFGYGWDSSEVELKIAMLRNPPNVLVENSSTNYKYTYLTTTEEGAGADDSRLFVYIYSNKTVLTLDVGVGGGGGSGGYIWNALDSSSCSAGGGGGGGYIEDSMTIGPGAMGIWQMYLQQGNGGGVIEERDKNGIYFEIEFNAIWNPYPNDFKHFWMISQTHSDGSVSKNKYNIPQTIELAKSFNNAFSYQWSQYPTNVATGDYNDIRNYLWPVIKSGVISKIGFSASWKDKFDTNSPITLTPWSSSVDISGTVDPSSVYFNRTFTQAGPPIIIQPTNTRIIPYAQSFFYGNLDTDTLQPNYMGLTNKFPKFACAFNSKQGKNSLIFVQRVDPLPYGSTIPDAPGVSSYLEYPGLIKKNYGSPESQGFISGPSGDFGKTIKSDVPMDDGSVKQLAIISKPIIAFGINKITNVLNMSGTNEHLFLQTFEGEAGSGLPGENNGQPFNTQNALYSGTKGGDSSSFNGGGNGGGFFETSSGGGGGMWVSGGGATTSDGGTGDSDGGGAGALGIKSILASNGFLARYGAGGGGGGPSFISAIGGRGSIYPLGSKILGGGPGANNSSTSGLNLTLLENAFVSGLDATIANNGYYFTRGENALDATFFGCGGGGPYIGGANIGKTSQAGGAGGNGFIILRFEKSLQFGIKCCPLIYKSPGVIECYKKTKYNTPYTVSGPGGPAKYRNLSSNQKNIMLKNADGSNWGTQRPLTRIQRGRWNFSLGNTKLNPVIGIIGDNNGNPIGYKNAQTLYKNTRLNLTKKQQYSYFARVGQYFNR